MCSHAQDTAWVMLLLDEPTENLGTEDDSISPLAEAISRFKAIEQIIAVTHSKDFGESWARDCSGERGGH